MKIENILATKGTKVVTVRAGQSLKEAIDLLVEFNIGALVVMNETEAGKLVGIISERDLIRAVARGEDIQTRRVSEVMTRKVIVASPQDDLESVMQTMTFKRFRHLPVLDKGKLVGIVSIGDIVKAQLGELRGEIETLETQIIGE